MKHTSYEASSTSLLDPNVLLSSMFSVIE